MPRVDSWSDLLPYTSAEIDLDGHAYRYIDEGQGDPIVMSHGNPTWSFYWRELVSSFRETHRTIAVDHLGCGRSDKPQNYPYSLSAHVDNLTTLLDRIDIRGATLVAHDWGGAIGLGAVLKRPERFARIVLLITAAFPPPYIPLRIRSCRLPLLGTLGMRGLNLFARAALWMAVEKRSSLSPEAKRGLIAPYHDWKSRIAIDRFVHDIPLTRKHPTWSVLEEIEKGFPGLSSMPSTMIWGMKDWCFRPECLYRLQELLPDATSVELNDVGHYVMEEAPECVVKCMREFLDANPLSDQGDAAGEDVSSPAGTPKALE